LPDMSSELGVGVVGIGFSGAAHARAVRLAGARLFGVAASTPQRAKEAASRLNADRAFPSAAALIEDQDVDVVHLCVPNDQHAPLAEMALAAGKHVVCEKPLALDPASAEGLVAAWQAAGTVATVPFVYRFYPMVRELRARIAAGELGRIHLVHGTYLQDWLSRQVDTDWRVDRGAGGPSRAFADVGSHWIDLAEFVLRDRIVLLSARFGTVFPERPNEDLALVQFETEGGALGSVVVSQVSPGRKNALVVEVSGTSGTGRFAQERPGSVWIGRREGATTLSADPTLLTKDAARHVVVPPGHPQGYLDCVDRFVADTYAAIKEAKPEGLPTFADGYRAVHIADTALQSSLSGGCWLEVAP
jgi:predicted dehydrogenase